MGGGGGEGEGGGGGREKGREVVGEREEEVKEASIVLILAEQ